MLILSYDSTLHCQTKLSAEYGKLQNRLLFILPLHQFHLPFCSFWFYGVGSRWVVEITEMLLSLSIFIPRIIDQVITYSIVLKRDLENPQIAKMEYCLPHSFSQLDEMGDTLVI